MMVGTIVLAALIAIISVNRFVLSRMDGNTVSFTNSVVFFIHALFIVGLISWFLSISSVEDLSDWTMLDQVIALNSVAVSIRNTVVVFSLAYLSYGIYKEYSEKKRKGLMLVSIFFLILTLLFMTGFILAGSFII